MSIASETPVPVAELFHENSKLPPRLGAAEPPPASTPQFVTKAYRTGRAVALPELVPVSMTLSDALERRRSVRHFGPSGLTLSALSQLLGWSHKLVSRPGEALPAGRSAPSAGALYPIEIYVGVSEVAGLERATYHYNGITHSLEMLAGCEVGALQGTSLYPEVTRDAAIIVVLVAIFMRTCRKYGERGYRFVLLDCGHVAQNLHLVATALGLGGVGIGGYLDDELNDLLELDGVNEAVVHTMAFGSLAS